MKEFYIKIAQKMDQTALSFTIGLISGWLINLVTGSLANYLIIAGSAVLFICVCCFFYLQLLNNTIRQQVDDDLAEEASKRLNDKYIPKPLSQVKHDAYCYEPDWQKRFLAVFFLGIITFAGSLILVVTGNQTVNAESDKQNNAQVRATESIDSILAVSKQIQSRLDSLAKQRQRPTPNTSPQPKKLGK